MSCLCLHPTCPPTDATEIQKLKNKINLLFRIKQLKTHMIVSLCDKCILSVAQKMHQM